MKQALILIIICTLIMIWCLVVFLRNDTTVYEPEVRIYVVQGRRMVDAKYLYAGSKLEYQFPEGYKMFITVELVNVRTSWTDSLKEEK